MTSEVERDVKIFHALQKDKIWHAFIVSDIAEKCTDMEEFKDSIDELLKQRNYGHSEKYNGALFLRGPYDSQTLALIREKLARRLPVNMYRELKGDYFKFLSRYYFWEIIDNKQSA